MSTRTERFNRGQVVKATDFRADISQLEIMHTPGLLNASIDDACRDVGRDPSEIVKTRLGIDYQALKAVNPQLDTTSRIRWSNAAVNTPACAPSECPMQPIRSRWTSGRVSSTSIARMLFQMIFIRPLA